MIESDALAKAIAQTVDQEYRLTERWTPLEPHPVQASLVWHPAKIKTCPAGRRSGKTELAKRDGILETLQDRPFPARIGFGAPTFSRAMEIFLEDLEAMIPKDWIKTQKRSMNFMEFRLLWGARIRIFGMSNPTQVEGSPWDKLYFDEVADYPKGCIEDNILPAIETRDRPGKVWFIGVPDEIGTNQAEYEKYWELGLQYPKDPDVCSFWWASSDILSPTAIARAADRMDDLKFRQEFGGEFVKSGGKAFPNFNPRVHLQDKYCAYAPTLPIDHALDFGSATGASLFGQHFKRNVWIMDELEGGSTEAMGDAFLSRCAERGYSTRTIEVYGDPAGRTPSSPTGISDYEALRQTYAGRNVIWNQLLAAVPIPDTVNAVRYALRARSGWVSLFVHSRCRHLIEDLKNADWPAKNNLKEFHHLACLRYYLFSLFGDVGRGISGVSSAALGGLESEALRFSSRG